jgi:ubiquinone/menaquinone biosynthesis C-methylase UbiE
MGFDVDPAAYQRFMGRFSEPLAAQLVTSLGAAVTGRALAVGCGPGALTARLVERLGPAGVTAVDPSEPFVAAVRTRCPDIPVLLGAAEALPFGDDVFDLAVAQLVVHFMSDPVAGIVEMSRVTRPGGVVAANVWDHAGQGGPLAAFWRAVQDVDPSAPGESLLPGTREGQLVELFSAAGLDQVEPWTATVRARYGSFDEWWETFTLGVGPAGAYVAGLDEPQRDAVRARCAELLPTGQFEITALAWCARGRVRSG